MTWNVLEALPPLRRQIVETALADAPSDIAADIPDLYHYTSPDAFRAIVENRTIWLTNAAYLNDQRELDYPIQLGSEVIDEFVKKYRRDVSVSLFLAGLQQTLAFHAEFKSWYVASLSTNGNLLSQWRAYCPAGGYSIGLVGSTIGAALSGQAGYRLRPVLYDSDKQRAALRAHVAKYLKFYSVDSPIKTELDYVNYAIELAEAFAISVGSEIVFFKSPAFSEEHEWRVARYREPSDNLHFRDRNGVLTPYLVLSIADGAGRLPLARVFISPLVESELSRHASVLFLEKCGFAHAEQIVNTPEFQLRF